MSLELKGFLIGLLVGTICLGGLGFGLWIVIKTYYNQRLKKFSAQLRYLFGALLLVGQFVAALKVLEAFEESKTAAVSVALGLAAAIFLITLLVSPFYLNDQRKK